MRFDDEMRFKKKKKKKKKLRLRVSNFEITVASNRYTTPSPLDLSRA